METRKTQQSPRICVRILLPCLASILFPGIAFAWPTVSTSGNPSPWAIVDYNVSYSISVTVQVQGGETGVVGCWAESNLGTTSGPDWSNSWSATPEYWFNEGTSGIHTFSVVNQQHGIYVWWRGVGQAFAPPTSVNTGTDPNPIGYFYTR